MENEPQTLRDAHSVATARRPRPGAEVSEWLRFHQANARMYREVSEVDRWHHHELKYWVGFEERKAEELAARMRSVPAGVVSGK
ncbi:AMED_5909 family protein [Amycolatopsis azurea]|uniref:Uncharacterized protein n=1 Tax=Amycolatopsis azurea DSM 43854 TaxID=1238180 RepID=A0ABX3J4U8_9PSEU|nr:AMED_5909 family protein [Amycolatopsis azurea]OOC02043.1 hypothetical protein B0293_34215 [Amycolatopsis azurea DSM 43854]